MSVEPPTPSNVIRDKAQLAKLYDVTDDELEELREWIASAGFPAALTKTLMKHVDSDLLVWAWDDKCNHAAKVRYPNYAGFVSVVKLLSEYKLRKVSEVKELRVTGRVVHELESLSSAELEQVAEGVWEPNLLPPAA